ncbi:DUF5723 family protein [Mariniflexile ostreae]|uniref:DUF5723 family protein n=1 Tax=Mariniflexile ostreae TaxID=1520892 RepID=A0ABV5FAG4_9FLAO
MSKVPYLMLLICCLSLAQNKQVLYGFSEIPQALMLNPGGDVKNDWYFGIPLLSHIHVSAGSSGSSAYDVFADDGVNFNNKLKAAIYSMEANDFLTMNEQLELFSGGFAFGDPYNKNKYLSFGLYKEFDFISYFPKDAAVLAYEGNQNNNNRHFNASHLNVKAEALSVFHVGFQKKVNKQFTYGVRGKVYSSIAHASSTKNKGSFVTQTGENNFYNHIFNLDLELQTSGLASLLDDDNSELKNDIKTLKNRLLFGGNLGLGFDVGFTYKWEDQWTVDGSLLDLGFITHTKDIKNFVLKGTYAFEGVDPFFSESENNQTADEYWNAMEADFEDLFDVERNTTRYTSWRPVKLNASLNYAFGKKRFKACDCLHPQTNEYQNRVGAQLYAIKRPRSTQMALTGYYYRRLFKGLSAKATYTVDPYSFSNVGLGLSAHLGNVNFYLMADNFLAYQNIYNAQSVSLQLGFNYIFKKNED